MSDTTNKVWEKYYRDIEKTLSCDKRRRRYTMENIRCGVNSYLQEHPGATLDEVTAYIGTIDEISDDYFHSIPVKEISAEVKTKKRIRIGIIVILAAALLAAVTVVVYLLVIIMKEPDSGYYVETGVQDVEDEVLSDDEEGEIVYEIIS